jgi:hypothetical protein
VKLEIVLAPKVKKRPRWRREGVKTRPTVALESWPPPGIVILHSNLMDITKKHE